MFRAKLRQEFLWGIVWGLTSGLILGFFGGVVKLLLEGAGAEGVNTNILFGFLIGLGSSLIWALIVRAGLTNETFLHILHPYKRFTASLKSLNPVVFEHLVLRLLLFSKDFLPLQFVYFLNEMSRRHLLEFDGDLDTETGGGAWRWRHRIIQEYFLKAEKNIKE